MGKSLSKVDNWNSGLTTREKVGGGMVLTGVGGTGLMFVAAMLPFITFPMLLIAMVLAGLFIAL